jgi:hypothetical protein
MAKKQMSGKGPGAGASRRKSQDVSPPRSSGGGHETIRITCSECYEEFAFHSGVPGDEIMCPVCEHTAQRPDDGQLHRVADLARKERSRALLTVLLLVAHLGAFAVWLFGFSENPTLSAESIVYAPIGVCVLSFLALVVLGWQYESNRHEAYF